MLREGMQSVAQLIPEVGEHTFASGGKRVRPLLVLLAAALCGYRGPRAVRVASAVEYLHTATLLHDDVVDGASRRRGRPSVNSLWGDRAAILVGDFLYARASQTLVEDGNRDILLIYSETIRTMAEGEVLQLARSFDSDLTESTYLDVIGRKTSTLLATATESGAILGDATRGERRSARAFGWEIGLAFQLVDDALDYSGDSEELGKAPLTDLAEGKVTMPLLASLKRCTVGEREGVASALKSFATQSGRGESPDIAELHAIAGLVDRYQGTEVTLQHAEERAVRARSRIASFAESDAKRALVELTEFVVQRRG
jgi:octaprenyl-diphosphate synthase